MTRPHLFPSFTRQGRSRTRFKVGYIDNKGVVVIDPVFDEGTRFYEGLASVAVGNRWGVINTSGEFVIPLASWGWCRFSDGLANIPVKGIWGIIDTTGHFLLKPTYDYLESFHEGRAVFRLGKFGERQSGWRYGYLNKNGAEAIPAVFHNACGFSEGLAAAKVGNLWGYIDSAGLFKITPRFEGTRQGLRRIEDTRAGYFRNGLAPVWSGQGYGFIDTTGKFVIEGFDDANSFCEGRAVVGQGKRFGFIDTEGRMIIECRFTLARDFSEGLARVELKEATVGLMSTTGFIDLQGQMVIEPTFFSAENFHDGLCLVTTEDLIGYVNRIGEFVWQGPFVEYGVLC